MENNNNRRPISLTNTHVPSTADTESLGACGVVCIVVLTIGASVAYLVAGIVILVASYGIEIKRDCEQSNIWVYSLLSVLVHISSISVANVANTGKVMKSTVLLSITKFPTASGDETSSSMCCLFLFEIGMSIWGGMELFKGLCPSLHHTDIYIFALVSLIKQLCTVSCFILFPCCISILMSTSSPPPPAPDERYSYDPVNFVKLRAESASTPSGVVQDKMSKGEDEMKMDSPASIGERVSTTNNQPILANDTTFVGDKGTQLVHSV